MLSLDHTLSGGGGINLTYDFVTRPERVIDTGGKHRMSLTYNVTNNKDFSLSCPAPRNWTQQNASFLADAAYRLNKDWRVLTSATLQTYAGQTFSDLEFTLGRRIGVRESAVDVLHFQSPPLLRSDCDTQVL